MLLRRVFLSCYKNYLNLRILIKNKKIKIFLNFLSDTFTDVSVMEISFEGMFLCVIYIPRISTMF